MMLTVFCVTPACQTKPNASLTSLFKQMNQSDCVKQSYSPSFWDLLRNMVLARGWSDGLYSIFNSVKTQSTQYESLCEIMIRDTLVQSSLMFLQRKYSNIDGDDSTISSRFPDFPLKRFPTSSRALGMTMLVGQSVIWSTGPQYFHTLRMDFHKIWWR